MCLIYSYGSFKTKKTHVKHMLKLLPYDDPSFLPVHLPVTGVTSIRVGKTSGPNGWNALEIHETSLARLTTRCSLMSREK